MADFDDGFKSTGGVAKKLLEAERLDIVRAFG